MPVEEPPGFGSDLRISVVIPTYNGFDRLKATVQSVLEQTAAPWETIVVDDGSTDCTPRIGEIFADRIHYLRTANGGQQRARNLGARGATGNWLAFLDHDDIWHNEYLAEVRALLRSHSVDVTLSNSRTWQEGPHGGFWKDLNRFTQYAPKDYWKSVGADPSSRWTILNRYDLASYLDFHPSQTSMLTIRRDLYLGLGGFDERMRGNGAENFEFEIRALREARVGLIWRPLVTMVRHLGNASHDSNRMTMDVVNCLRFILKHHDLKKSEQDVIEGILQKRLPDAIGGAFFLGNYKDVRIYKREYYGKLSFKAAVKCVISSLPPPLVASVIWLLRPIIQLRSLTMEATRRFRAGDLRSNGTKRRRFAP